MDRRIILPVLAACGLILAFSKAAGPASALSPSSGPGPGPGAVLEMHKKLLAALDSGDVAGAKAFVAASEEALYFLPDETGSPARYAGAAAASDRLGRWAEESRRAGGFESRITNVQADCPSGSLSYAVLELERVRSTKEGKAVARYRSTSLVRYVDDTWKLMHWHLSSAEAPLPAK